MIIYRAISPSGKSYIGMTQDFEWRKHKHNKDSTRRNCKFHSAIRKYGIDGLDWRILARLGKSRKIAGYVEMFFIWLYRTQKNGYNMTKGGDGVNCLKGLVHSKESLRNRSKAMCEPINVFDGNTLKHIGTWQLRADCEEALGITVGSIGPYLSTRNDANSTLPRKKIFGYYITTDDINYVSNHKNEILSFLNTRKKDTSTKWNNGKKYTREEIKAKHIKAGYKFVLYRSNITGEEKVLYSVAEASRYSGIDSNRVIKHLKGIKKIKDYEFTYI